MRYRKSIFRDKSFLAMAGISVLAIAAIAGGLMLKGSGDEEPTTGYIADLNDNRLLPTPDSSEIAANNGATKASGENRTTADKSTEDKESETSSRTPSEDETTAVVSPTPDGNTSEAGVGVSGFTFSVGSTLTWPVETNDVIIEYSPDATVYFATLDKYKTSNAISIRSQVGTPVYAAAAGTISDIGYNEEIGNSVSLDLGSNYTLQYGQIKDIQVSEGDVVSEGDLLCYVANPTKYYSVEGPNLYLKLTNAEGTVDPLDYLNFKE